MTTTLWLDLHAGMSGDMFLGALIDVGADRARLTALVDDLALKNARVDVTRVTRAGFAATKVDVHFADDDDHRHLSDIFKIIDRATTLSPRAMAWAKDTFTALARAEAAVHGTSVDNVHFHEVGAVDAIIDIVGAAVLLDSLNVDHVVATPVRTGFGTIKAAHGDMSIPAPATARLLEGIPAFAGDVPGEALTPTGAALLGTLVTSFGQLPAGTTTATGMGAGTRDPERHANVVRATLVDATLVNEGAAKTTGFIEEQISEIEFHVDDMTGEDLGFLTELLLMRRALDVVIQPVVGKKSRPAHLVRVLVNPPHVDTMLAVVFEHASTLGARVREERRVSLAREDVVVETRFGAIRGKRTAFAGVRVRPEYDDVAAAARTHGVAVRAVRAAFDDAVAALKP